MKKLPKNAVLVMVFMLFVLGFGLAWVIVDPVTDREYLFSLLGLGFGAFSGHVFALLTYAEKENNNKKTGG